MYSLLATSEFGLGEVTADELIAGARLEWSAMFAVSNDYKKWNEFESTTFKNLASRLRNALSEAGLQSIQFQYCGHFSVW
jgi:hypothetical protein